MAERALMMLWGVEPRPTTWAANIAAAQAAFTRVTGRAATHIIVSPTAPAPPIDCKLVWRTSVIRVEAGMFQIGTEEMP